MSFKKFITQMLCVVVCMLVATMFYNYIVYKQDTSRIEQQIVEIDTRNSTLKENIKDLSTQLEEVERLTTDITFELLQLSSKGGYETQTIEALQKDNLKLLNQAQDLVLRHGKDLGLTISYQELTTTDELIMEERLANDLAKTVLDALGVGQLIQVVEIIEVIQYLNATTQMEYTPESLITLIAESLATQGKKIDQFAEANEEDLTTKKLGACITSMELIGATYEKVNEMTQGQVSDYHIWQTINEELVKIYQQILSNERKIVSLGGAVQ